MEIITTHPDHTVGDLTTAAQNGVVVERTGHIGNAVQDELALLATQGVRLEMAETQGDDAYASPYHVINPDGTKTTLDGKASRKKHRTYMVGQITIPSDRNAGEASPRKNLLEYHLNALRGIAPEPQDVECFLTHYQEKYPDVMHALQQATLEAGAVRRGVDDNGKVQHLNPEDINPKDTADFYRHNGRKKGYLLPVEAQMAAAIATKAQQSHDHTIHLGSHDMMSYTKNERLMSATYELARRTLAIMGIDGPRRFNFAVQDCRGIADNYTRATGNAIPPSQHAATKQDILKIRDTMDTTLKLGL